MRRKKGYERRRSPRGLSNSKSPKSNSNQQSPKRSRSRSNRSEFKDDQENDSRQGDDDQNQAGLDDRERKRAQRRAARQDDGRGSSPKEDYYKSYRGGDRDRYDRRRHRIQYPPLRDRLYTRKDFDQYQTSRFDKQELTDSYNDYVQLYKKDQENDFYQDHKSEPWFIERYNPSQIYHWKTT